VCSSRGLYRDQGSVVEAATNQEFFSLFAGLGDFTPALRRRRDKHCPPLSTIHQLIMKKTSLPTVQEIEELTAFLPRLYAEGFLPIVKWEGGDKRSDGSFTVPYPNYNPVAEEFFKRIQGNWIDYEYNPEQAYAMLKDESLVKTASLDQVKSMLTFCKRGERFSDGHWAVMIEKGYIRRLLERLNVIKLEEGI
jgi:hypothetical protein